MLSIALRFVPTLMDETEKIMELMNGLVRWISAKAT